MPLIANVPHTLGEYNAANVSTKTSLIDNKNVMCCLPSTCRIIEDTDEISGLYDPPYPDWS
jgi:hypothetical protein